jgi:2-polyprenyl-3-methyl-5-hydroxy-6-metoxy-1,4-benzoquinol methylase
MTQEPTAKSPKSPPRTLAKLFYRLRDGISWRVRAMFRRAHDTRLALGVLFGHIAGRKEPETKLIKDSQSYWNTQSSRSYEQDSHWRGGGIFADESRWVALGLQHLQLYQEFARIAPLGRPLKRIVEWGCGGGMNAIHFGHLADEFCGIDIARASLEECKKQMSSVGLHNFTPILIEASEPEAALGRVAEPCELFLCTYVFEVLPSPEYGIRILRIAHQLLAPGGMALVQIKYKDSWRTASRMWGYAKNLAWHTTYRIEEFWQAAEQSGFTAKMITLVPKQTLINDQNYAYFLLLKSATTT